MKERCKYGKNCLAVKSGSEGGTFGPVLKFRLIGVKLVVKCFSFKEERDENNNL